MSYEILLSDSARRDLEKNPSDILTKLLERIGYAALLDHVLSAPESEFELRYQSLGATYVFFRREEEPKRVMVASFCELSVPPASLPTVEPQIRFVDHRMRDIPHGVEVETTLEMRPPGQPPELRTVLFRKVDMGDSYMTFQHSPLGTTIITGVKGTVDGDFRRDTIEMIHMKPDGAVTRFPANEVPVWTKNPFESDGATLHERVGQFMASSGFAARMQQYRNLFNPLEGTDAPVE